MIDPATAKTYVIDTNVLLHNPNSIFVFAENHLVIPMTVLEELDRFKSTNNELGANAREVARGLDKLRALGSLREGVPTKQGGLIQVVLRYDDLVGMLPGVADNRILGCAHLLKREGRDVAFVSKDINARIKADALGIPSEDFRNQKVDFDALYTGWTALDVSAAMVDTAFSEGGLPVADLPNVEELDLTANQFVLLRDELNEKRAALCIYEAETKSLRRLGDDPARRYGVGPRSLEQRMAFELLLNDDVRLVTLVGRAGTGKTLLALACGLSKVLNEERYTKMLVSRPIMPLGKDIGYLPGSKDDKLSHWMGPIFDNLQFLLGAEERDPDEIIRRLIADERINMEALTYIRGRSITKQYMIVDEAQNLTPHEIKTIISRVGTDTKIVLTGDPNQIDNPYLDANSNGLTYVVERMRGQGLAGHMTLTKSERSELAGIAASIL